MMLKNAMIGFLALVGLPFLGMADDPQPDSTNLRGDPNDDRDLQQVYKFNVKVDMCLDGETITVLTQEVGGMMRIGATLGPCDDPSTRIKSIMQGLGEAAKELGQMELDIEGAGILSSGDAMVAGAVNRNLEDESGAVILRNQQVVGLTWIDVPNNDCNLERGYYGCRPRNNEDGRVVVDMIRADTGEVVDTIVPEVWRDGLESEEEGTNFYGEVVPEGFNATGTTRRQLRRRRWRLSIWIGGRRWRLCIIIGSR